MPRDAWESRDKRLCFVCREAIEESEGVRWFGYGILVHRQECHAIVQREHKDYSRSNKGRIRTGKEIRKRLRELRGVGLR